MAEDTPVVPTTRPLLLPEKFSGEGEWSQWICHFENVAAVNSWNEECKLLWFKVRLTVRAQLAFQHLPEDARANYGEARKALKERFNPESRKDRYRTEFQMRRKKRTEGWPDYGEDLRTLVNKAYPHLEPAARDQMALMHYLSQIDNTQVSFSVKQQRPGTLDAAVSATLEIESYLGPNMEVAEVREKPKAVAAALSEELTATAMKKLLDRMDRLETELTTTRKERQDFMTQKSKSAASLPPNPRYGGRRVVTSWTCGRRGHVSQDCWNQPYQEGQQHQGNGKPSVGGANH